MDLSEIREQIDAIDQELVQCFVKRMALSAQVAKYKKEHNLPIYVPERELQVLDKVAAQAGSDMSDYIKTLYVSLLEVSKAYQAARNNEVTE